MVEMRIRGADQLANLARDFKTEADGKQRKKDMLRGLRNAAKPIAKEVAPRAARERLPSTGGLNEYVASSKFGVRTRTAGQNVGVKVVGVKGKHDLAGLDRGQVRHPVYGHRDRWATQQITPGWWTLGVADSDVVDPMRRELVKVMDEIVRRIARGG